MEPALSSHGLTMRQVAKHIMATDYSLCTGWANSCSNISQRQIASYELENLCENLCLSVATQAAKNQIRLNLCDLLQ